MRPLGAFLLGILLYQATGPHVPFAGIGAAFFVLLFLGAWWYAKKKPLTRRRRVAGVAGLLMVTALSFWSCFLKNRPETLPVAPEAVSHAQVTLVEGVAVKPNTVSTVGRLSAIKVNGKWEPAHGKVALFFARSPQTDSLRYGHQLLVKGSLAEPAPPANPFQFDNQQFLARKHIQWQVYVTPDRLLITGSDPPSALKALSYRLRRTMEEAFATYLPQKRELAIAQALVLGVKDNLDPSLRNTYSRTGTMHVLAVSGLHVGTFYALLFFLLKPLRTRRKGRVVVGLALILFLWFYAYLTGLAPSVLRAVTMFTIVEAGMLLNRKASVLNSLSVAAMVLLALEPNLLFDVGFQLSFSAVAGIVLLQPLLTRVWEPGNRVVRFFWQLGTVSVAAQVATAPLGFYYFHQFPLYFGVTNLFAVPLATGALWVGIFLLLLSPVPGLATWVAKVLQGILWLMNEGLHLVEQWPTAVLDGFVITPGQVLALYLLVLAVVLFILRRQLSWLTAATLCLAFLSGTELAEAHRLRRKKELVIHSVRKSSATSILQGRQVTFLADSGFYAQPQNFAYQVQPLWWARDVREEVRFGPDFQKTGQKQQVPVHVTPPGNRLVVWQGKRLLWLNKLPKALAQPVNVEAVVLQHNVWAPVEKLAAVMTTRVVVLDQTNSRNYVQRRRQELTEAGYRVHVLEQDGAWCIRLP
ncbi:ComEC/Rec2 family competence protein [Rufibacter quisquiliarum]|nr:ComEC/Rec2 family competence protein [Rufibacter quisquiliarum]